MADDKKQQEGAERSDVETKEAGPPNPSSMVALAEDLPEDDAVLKEYKQQMTATDAQAEAKASAKLAELSPHATDTPSGAALQEVTGVSSDEKRGERYAAEKSKRRWGYVPAEE